jgi:hypothetical protein
MRITQMPRTQQLSKTDMLCLSFHSVCRAIPQSAQAFQLWNTRCWSEIEDYLDSFGAVSAQAPYGSATFAPAGTA